MGGKNPFANRRDWPWALQWMILSIWAVGRARYMQCMFRCLRWTC